MKDLIPAGLRGSASIAVLAVALASAAVPAMAQTSSMAQSAPATPVTSAMPATPTVSAAGTDAAAGAALPDQASPTTTGPVATTPPVPASPTIAGDVVVTGSRIRGVGPVGSNVISLGAADIVKIAPLTVADLLKTAPQISNLGYDEASFGNTTGIGNVTRAGGVNIHGLGPQATLVLFDGHRFPLQGPQGSIVDPSSIPTIALERVEIVPDGASAVYGSDAVAGVVNFVPRRSFEGVQAIARYGVADDYSQRQLSVIGGTRWSGGGAWIAFEHSDHDRLRGIDRSFFQSNLTGRGGTDYRPFQCNPGNLVIGGVSYAIPAAGVTPSALVAGTQNRCDVTRAGDILPSQTRNSVAARASQDIGSHVTIWAEGFYSARLFNANVTAQGSSTVLANLTVPRTNAFFVAPTGLTPASETIQYSFLSEYGPLVQTGSEKNANIYGGVDLKLPGNWRANVTGLYGRNTSIATNAQVNASALATALASSNPATAFNPYGVGVNSQAVLAGIFSNIFQPFARNEISGVEARADGPLFRLPGGQVRLAFGGEYDRFSINGYTERGLLTAPTFLYTVNSRTVKSIYGELFVPIFGVDNALPGLRKLDLSVAGRRDDYSDVGATTNPKVGVNWTPFEGLQLKASYGKSFRAPFLTDTLLFRPGTTIASATLPDPNSPTGQSTGIRYVAGNPNLTPETAKTFSGGLDYRFPFLRGLSVNATYFSIDYDNQISSQLQNNAVLQQQAIYSSLIIRNPTAAQVAALVAQGYPVSGVLPANPAFIIDGRPNNLGKSKVKGIDFGAIYDMKTTAAGEFQVGVSGTYGLKFDLAQTPAAALTDQLNNIGYPLRLRGRGNVTWDYGPIEIVVFANYSSPYNNNLVTPIQRVSSYTTFDLHLAYSFGDRAASILPGVLLTLDMTNAFDRNPPYVNIDGGYDSQVASALGRQVIFGISKKF